MSEGWRGKAVQHSSFLKGHAAAFAGEWKVVQGRVVGLADQSGHYKPPLRSTEAFLRELHQRGVLPRDIELIILSKRR